MYALVDCNNFFASCERLFVPQLRNKPVVVLSNNDGCVVARSNEAKALGISMAAPAFKCRKLFREQNVAVFSSNYPLYCDLSKRVMECLAQLAPEIEIYSIDEAFLVFEHCDYIDFFSYGKQIKKQVERSTGIPVSVGFAESKTLAKLAAHVAKKFPDRTGGVYVVDTEEKRIKALKWLEVGEVWGIGRKHSKRLQSYGIRTAYQFTQQEDDWVRAQMSIIGLRTKNELLGIPCVELDHYESKKSISTTRTFSQPTSEYNYLRERVASFADSCAEKLRKQNSHCNLLQVFLSTNSHQEDKIQYHPKVMIRLPFSTNSSIDIVHHAIEGLKQIYKKEFFYKRAGVCIMAFSSVDNCQGNLFEQPNPKHKRLMETVDCINGNIGQKKVKLAAQEPGVEWKMKQEKLSPRYTTQLSEVLVVKAN